MEDIIVMISESGAPQPPTHKCRCGRDISVEYDTCDRCTKKAKRCKCGDTFLFMGTDLCYECHKREREMYNMRNSTFVFYEPIKTYGIIEIAAISPHKMEKLIMKSGKCREQRATEFAGRQTRMVNCAERDHDEFGRMRDDEMRDIKNYQKIDSRFIDIRRMVRKK